MDIVTVSIAKAVICFMSACHPVLTGPRTPIGTFRMEPVLTQERGYDGDVIIFDEKKHSAFALHRVWLLSEKTQHRWRRIHSDDPKQRNSITNGCINLLPKDYLALRSYVKSGNTTLVVTRQ